MSIKIHHGPDGTFKTSGAIKDDILNVIKSGRTLVTNIRGFSYDNTVAVLGEDFVHDDFKVIHIDTDIAEGRDKLSKFFHWAPKGAFFVIDEVQRIFPPKWGKADLAKLDYLEDQGHIPNEERKPETIEVAWDMQRHHNWDFIFTTTNIKKVHEMARVMAKVAVRHVNVGVWRFYKTVEHDAESNGKTAASITTVRVLNYVPSRIFKLYASTTTGTFENSEPRTPFYKDVKILSLLVMLACLWVYIFSKPAIGVFEADEQKDAEIVKTDTDKTKDIQSDKVVNKIPPNKAGDISSRSKVYKLDNYVRSVKTVPEAFLSQFNKFFINGYSKSLEDVTIVFTGYIGQSEYQLTSDSLFNYGIKASLIGECLAELSFYEHNVYVFCEPRKVDDYIERYDFQPPEPSIVAVSG